MKRINLFTGHFGSGKTEIALNVAHHLKTAGTKAVTLVDLDIVNPYFCSRDLEDDLTEKGIRIISQGRHLANAELMVVTPEVLSAFNKKDHTVVFDVGGDDMGAVALGQYNRFFQEEDYDLYFVVNYNRPLTRDAHSVLDVLTAIEGTSRLKVTKLINNTNLGAQTTLKDIQRGEELLLELVRLTGLPHAFTAVRSDLVEEARRVVKGEILPLTIYMKPPWLD